MRRRFDLDHDTRMAAAKRNDPQLAARIVRNIKEIEDDFFHSAWPLSERILLESTQAIKEVVKDPWYVVEAEWAVRVVCPEWKMLRGVGTGDMWLELCELSADQNGYEHSWLAAAVKAAPTELCIAVVFRPGLQDYVRPTFADGKALAPLFKAGFTYDEERDALFLPIDIQAEALAKGFEENDLGAALLPMEQAMSRATAAKAELDKLLETIRKVAKGK